MLKQPAWLLVLAAVVCAAGFARAAGEDKDFHQAQYLYTLQEYQMAADAFAKYLAAYPKGERCEKARLLLAESLYQLKDYTKAAQQFDRFIADFTSAGDRPEALQRAVKAHWLAKEFDQSVACAEIFLKENGAKLKKPDAPAALRKQCEYVLFYAGDASYNLKKAEPARAFWESLEKDFAQSALLPDAAEGLGWVAFESEQFTEALKQFALTAAAPGHLRAAASQLMAARALERLGKLDDALAALDKVAALTGGDKEARESALWKAVFLLKAGRDGEAVAAYKILVQGFAAHPDTPSAVLQAVAQTETQNKHAETLALAELYLASFPKGDNRALVARMKTRALSALSRQDDAVAAARAAVREAEALPGGSPEYSEQRPLALLLLAETLGPVGLPQYELLLKDHPASRCAAPARFQLACLAAQADKLPEALSQAEALLKDLGQNGAPALPPNEREELYRKTLFAAADFAFRLNHREQAEKNLQAYSELRAVQSNPAAMQLPLVMLRLAWCRHGANDFAGAIALLDKALALNPEGPLRHEMCYLRGRAKLDESIGSAGFQPAPGSAGFQPAPGSAGFQPATEAGKMPALPAQKLLEDYHRLLKEAPDSGFTAHACYDAAQFLNKHAPEEALPWLDKLLGQPAFADSPLRPDGLLLRARIRYALGKNADALADVETCLKSQAFQKTGAAPAAYLLQGLCLEALPGKDADAEKCYTELLAAGPAEAAEVKAGLLRRAKLRFNAKRFPEAQADLRALLSGKESKPENAADVEAAVLLAVCHKELKDNAGAQAQLEKLASRALCGPAAFEVPFQLGNLAYEAARHADAAGYYQKALAAAAQVKDLPLPALSAAWLNLAWSQKRANEPRKAEAAFAELIKLEPLGPFAAEARYQRGRLLAETGDAGQALAQWRELLEKQADSPLASKALCGIAETQAKAGQFADSAKFFEQYLGKFPAGEAAREAWCGLAECRLHLNNSAGARAAFLKAAGDKPPDAELDDVGERAVLGLAELALNQNDAKECKKQALRVVLDRPDSKWLEDALYLCARASEELSEPSQAIGYYRKLLAERPKSERAASAKERLKALGAP